jgi:hypothetical protein
VRAKAGKPASMARRVLSRRFDTNNMLFAVASAPWARACTLTAPGVAFVDRASERAAFEPPFLFWAERALAFVSLDVGLSKSNLDICVGCRAIASVVYREQYLKTH